jgi:hypothetical protein
VSTPSPVVSQPDTASMDKKTKADFFFTIIPFK